MCGPYFNLKAAKPLPVSGYDIHIYFGKDSWQDRFLADALAQALAEAFPRDVKRVQEIGIKGPHSSPNIEVDITPESFGKVLTWLQMNHEHLSILIHPHTGDEMRDHTALANWVGEPLPLKLEALQPAPSPKKPGAQPPSLQ